MRYFLLSLLFLLGCAKAPVNPIDTSVMVTVVYHKVYEGNLYIYRNFTGDTTRNVTVMGCPDSINGTTTNYWKGDTLTAVYPVNDSARISKSLYVTKDTTWIVN